jgi:hypothetical protein
MDYDIDTKDLLSSLRLIERGSLLPTYRNETQDNKIHRKRKKISQIIPGKKRIPVADTESTSNSEMNDPICVDDDSNIPIDRNIDINQFTSNPADHDRFSKIHRKRENNDDIQLKEDFRIVKPPPLSRTQGNEDSKILLDEHANIPFLLSDNDAMTDNRSLLKESYSNNKESNNSNYTNNDMDKDDTNINNRSYVIKSYSD